MHDLSFFHVGAILLGISTLLYYIVHRFTKFQESIGLVLVSLISIGLIVTIDAVAPTLGVMAETKAFLWRIDFESFVLKGILSFLLFAAALEVDLTAMRQRWRPILALATIGVALSMMTMAWLLPAAAGLFGIALPFMIALTLGAIVAATDPVAVGAVMKTMPIPATLRSKVEGESLFNDGIAVVLFLVVVALAFPGEAGHATGIADGAILFVQEAGGGLLIGGVAGWLCYLALKSVDHYKLEAMVTLSTVMLTYTVCEFLHVSGPLAVVVAGLIVGSMAKTHAMSENTRHNLHVIWESIDSILNVVLFSLVGLDVLFIIEGLTSEIIAVSILAIAISLIARAVAVWVPLTLLPVGRDFTPGARTVLWWGGLRGGISIALALSLPESEWKPMILAASFAVVVFTILVQGSTIGHVIRKRVLERMSDRNESAGAA